MLRLHNTAMGMDTSAAMAELWKEGKVRFFKIAKQEINEDSQLLDCRLVCKDGEALASRAVLAAHSSLLASAMTGEANNNEEEIFLPEASVEHLSPLLSVLHGSQINQVNWQCITMIYSKIYLRIGRMTLSSWRFCWGLMASLL